MTGKESVLHRVDNNESRKPQLGTHKYKSKKIRTSCHHHPQIWFEAWITAWSLITADRNQDNWRRLCGRHIRYSRTFQSFVSQDNRFVRAISLLGTTVEFFFYPWRNLSKVYINLRTRFVEWLKKYFFKPFQNSWQPLPFSLVSFNLYL